MPGEPAAQNREIIVERIVQRFHANARVICDLVFQTAAGNHALIIVIDGDTDRAIHQPALAGETEPYANGAHRIVAEADIAFSAVKQVAVLPIVPELQTAEKFTVPVDSAAQMPPEIQTGPIIVSYFNWLRHRQWHCTPQIRRKRR